MDKNEINITQHGGEKPTLKLDTKPTMESIMPLGGALEIWAKERQANSYLVTRLTRADQKEQTLIESWIKQLAPSANTMSELLRLADEISARDRVAVYEILAAPEIEKLLSADGLSRKDKQRFLRKELESRRYPIRQKIADRLSNLQGQITRETGIKVDLPEDLEGDSILFSFKARSPEQLATVAAQVVALATSKEVSELYAILLGKIDHL